MKVGPEILPVALITTALNEAETIPDFCKRLAAGTALPAEWIISDGGSIDETVSILRNISLEDVEIQIIVEAGANIARGRNIAIRRARFNVLAITDFGCLVDKHWLQRITEPLLSDQTVDVVSGGYRLEGTTFFERAAVASSVPISHLDSTQFLPSSRSFALRKDVLNSVGGYPEHLTFAGEDTALCLALKSSAARFVTRFDAEVVWIPRKNLHAFLRQHYLYGVGDGEMRQQNNFYFRITVKWLANLIVLLLGIRFHYLWSLYFILAVLYYLYLRPKYEWASVSLCTSGTAIMLVTLKEIFLLLGYIKGTVFGGTESGG